MNENDEENQVTSINLNDFEEEEDESPTEIKITLLSGKSYEVEYMQLFKYSKIVKEQYPFKIAKAGDFSYLIQEQQQKYNIDEKNIIQFFRLIQEMNVNLSIDNVFDLWALSIILEVSRLKKLISKFIKKNENDVNFLSKLFVVKDSQQYDDLREFSEIKINIEEQLIKKIEDCLQSPNFEKLPISVVYRIVEKSDPESYTSDSLYNFISKSTEERYVLFPFIRFESLSDENFRNLANLMNEDNYKNYKDFLKGNFGFINSLKNEKTELQQRIEDLLNDNQQLDSKVTELINLHEQNLENEREKYFEQIEAVNEKEIDQKFLKEEKQIADKNLKKIELIMKKINLNQIGEYNEEGVSCLNISKYASTCCLRNRKLRTC